MISPKSDDFQKLFLSVILATILAKGVALFPAYSIDDWVQAPRLLNHKQLITHVLTEGRFGQAFIIYLLEQINSTLYNIYFLGVGLAIVAIVLFSSLAAQFLLIEGRWRQFVVAAIIANHPYTVEIFTWKSVAIFYALPLLLISVPLLKQPRTVSGFIVSSTAIALAISLYQPILSFVLVLVLGRWAAESMRKDKQDEAPAVAMPLLGASVVGTVLYFVLNKVAQTIFSVSLNSRAALISLDSFGERLERAAVFYKAYFYGVEIMNPIAIKSILLSIIIVGYLFLLHAAIRRSNRPLDGLKFVLWQVVLAAGIGLGSLSFLLVLSLWWPVPRMLSHAGLVWGGLLLPALRYARHRGLGQSLVILLSFVVLGYVAINNAVLTDQIRLNQRDRLKVNRIATEIERLPTYLNIKELRVVGYEPFYKDGITWVVGEMNTSGFYGRFGIFSEILGIPVGHGRTEDCAEKPKWPAAGSVFANGSSAIVCLN